MSRPRATAVPNKPIGVFHCTTRIVDHVFKLGPAEKDKLMEFMRAYEAFCEVQVLAFCMMSNHFHILVDVRELPEGYQLSDDEWCAKMRLIQGDFSYGVTVRQLKLYRSLGQDEKAEDYKARQYKRMGSVSFFMKGIKQRFTQWFNAVHDREGTLWESKFHSVLVQDAAMAMQVIACYIDLNPIRAAIVDDPAAYRWCSYAEALRGDVQSLNGLAKVLGCDRYVEGASERSFERQGKTWEQGVLEAYREWLYVEGVERPAAVSHKGTTRRESRAGFSAAESFAMRRSGGALPQAESLRRRVRQLTRGRLFGSQEFVTDWHQANSSMPTVS